MARNIAGILKIAAKIPALLRLRERGDPKKYNLALSMACMAQLEQFPIP
jgi:hypothetical protein